MKLKEKWILLGKNQVIIEDLFFHSSRRSFTYDRSIQDTIYLTWL